MKPNLMDLALLQDDSEFQVTPNEDQALDEKDIKNILQIKPHKRTDAHIQILKNQVKDIKVFKEFQQSEEQLNELCKNLHLKILPENKILFEQGDRGDSYFIILEGSVDILVKVLDDKSGQEYNKKVAVLKKGDAFGDLSLLYGAPRNATVKTKEDCYFIVMSKATYDIVIKSHQVEKIHEIAQYYLNFPLFQDLDKITLMYFATKTINQKLQSKQVVVKQGDDPGRVYFVKSGRLKVIKKVNFRKLPENGFLQFDELIDEPLITEVRKSLCDMKLLQLDIVEQGDVFCHNAIIDHKSVDYTVITEVPCEVFIINEMDFLTLNKKILDSFQEYIKPYPTDKELRRTYYETIRWKNYKSNMMDIIKLNKAMKIPFNSLLRGDITVPKRLSTDYLHVSDKTIVYHNGFKNQKQISLKQLQESKKQNNIFEPQPMRCTILEEEDESNSKKKSMKINKQNKAVFKVKELSQISHRRRHGDEIKGLDDLFKVKPNYYQSFKEEGIQTARLYNQRNDYFTKSHASRQPELQLEQKKNTLIFKLDKLDSQFQITCNQRNRLSTGVLPPVTIKLIKKSKSTARI